jgi:xanthine dehydrogenase accessory factor
VRELLDTIDAWLAQDKRVALATVVTAEGSTPRPVGAMLALTEDGHLAGSVSGGCIESDVYEHALEVLETGKPQMLRYGFTEDMAFEIGLACGGSVQVYIEPLVP